MDKCKDVPSGTYHVPWKRSDGERSAPPQLSHTIRSMSQKLSEINLKVHLDDENVPNTIEWQATDAPEPGMQEAKAMMISLWDAEARNALRIDLWTKDMSIDDMNDFFFQVLLTMADTYKRATNNKEIMADMKQFARDFAEKASKMTSQS